MIKTILVPATGSDTDEIVFEAALSVARMFSSHLDFLHVRIDPLETIAAMGSADIGGTMAAAACWMAGTLKPSSGSRGPTGNSFGFATRRGW